MDIGQLPHVLGGFDTSDVHVKLAVPRLLQAITCTDTVKTIGCLTALSLPTEDCSFCRDKFTGVAGLCGGGRSSKSGGAQHSRSICPRNSLMIHTAISLAGTSGDHIGGWLPVCSLLAT